MRIPQKLKHTQLVNRPGPVYNMTGALLPISGRVGLVILVAGVDDLGLFHGDDFAARFAGEEIYSLE